MVLRRTKPSRLMLLDGDIICYAQCTSRDYLKEHHNEKDEYWEVLDGAGVKNEICSRIDQLMGMLRCSDIIVAFGSRDNFRKRLEPDYKAHRKTKKPLGYHAIVEWCKQEFTSLSYPTLEADDILGILQTGPDLIAHQETVIVSNDKDMRTIPGLFYNPDIIDAFTPEVISQESAIQFLACQSLAGDTADGYKGCPGIGMVKAEKIIAPMLAEAMQHSCPMSYLFWVGILPTFLANGFDEEYALVQCQLARILRREDIKTKGNEWIPRIWKPIPFDKLTRASASRKSIRRRKNRS